MFKVIIAGTRTFEDYTLLCEEVKKFLKGKRPSEVEIVSGRAKGADRLGERFAKEHHCALKLFPAEWKKYGNHAGPMRNAQMGHYADACIIFWDGKSSGTKHMMEFAEREGLWLSVVRYDG